MSAKRKLHLGGALLLALLAFFCAVALLSPHSPAATDLSQSLTPPSLAGGHPLGTDKVGRDLLLRLARGGLASLAIALCAVGVQFFLGVSAGLCAGWLHPKSDPTISFLTDVFLSLPSLVVLIAVSAMLGDYTGGAGRVPALIFAIGLLSWPTVARMVRTQSQSLSSAACVRFARAQGMGRGAVARRVLLPNMAGELGVLFSLAMGETILLESAVSFLGLGVTEPQPTLGALVSAATRTDMKARVWLWLPAGICIFLIVLAFSLIGEGLEHRREER